MIKVGVGLAACIFSSGLALGQSAIDLDARYGKPTSVYSVSEHIWMNAQLGSDGQVCQVRLFPKRVSDDTNYLSQKLPLDELIDVLNALVPIDQRGAKRESFGATATGGPSAWTTYAYEKATFTFISSFPKSGFDHSTLKKGEFVFSIQDTEGGQKLGSSPPSEDDFRDSRKSGPEIVAVLWNNRRCQAQ